MAAPHAIEVEGVSKRYLLGEDHVTRGSLTQALSSRLARLRPSRRDQNRDEIWSLRDVDLTVDEGQAIGLVGRNGAGKSTLLKILARITEPTEGVSRVRGRVGSLLEVGTGFHPELTGRENVYLSGVINGMAKREVERRFDDIVEFSGVQRFLDTPMKRYSSGMYLRLAFAVAASLDSEVLLVDEVLAVGDAEFQRRCLGRMADVESSGRTIVFVSHNLDAIQRLCSEAVWLDRGQVVMRGPSAEVTDRYLGADVKRVGETLLRADEAAGVVAVERVAILGADGRPADVLPRDEPFTVEVTFDVRERVPGLDLSVYIQTLGGVRVIDEAWSDAGEPLGVGRFTVRMQVPPVLNVGNFSIGVWMGTGFEELFWRDGVVVFRLEGDTQARTERLLQLGVPWSISAGTADA
jgi:ABC-2 type transport system ATP-binding protein/lipopolysaccharide transport system ATP-binding protein